MAEPLSGKEARKILLGLFTDYYAPMLLGGSWKALQANESRQKNKRRAEEILTALYGRIPYSSLVEAKTKITAPLKTEDEDALVGFMQGTIRSGRIMSQQEVGDFLIDQKRAKNLFSAIRGPEPTEPTLDVNLIGGGVTPYWKTQPAMPGEEGEAEGVGGMELPASFLNALPEDTRAFVQGLIAKSAAGKTSQVEEDMLQSFMAMGFKGAYGAGAGGAGDALGYAQLAESQRQFDISQAFQRERERNALEDALSKLRMRGVEESGSQMRNMQDIWSRFAPYSLPPGTTTVPGFEPGGIFQRAGYTQPPISQMNLAAPGQYMQGQASQAINPLLQYIQQQQGGQ